MPDGARRPTLLCLGYYPYDAVHLFTVAKEAQRRLGLEPVFVSLAPADAAAQVRDQVAAEGFESLDRAVRAEPDVSERNLFRRARRQREETDRLMTDLLDEVRPAAVLATVNPMPGLFLDEAARRGVPTVLIQLFHWGDRSFYRELQADDRRAEDARIEAGWSASIRLRSRIRRRARRLLQRRLEARYRLGPYVAWELDEATIAVQGPAMRRRLVAEGVPADHVVVTGNPALDDLHGLRASLVGARDRLAAQLGLPRHGTVVSQMRSHEERLSTLDRNTRNDAQAQIVRALQDAAPDACIVVKVHPKEDEAEKAFLRSLDPAPIVVGDEVSTNDLLAASDVVVGTLSTTLLYSVLLDRPTVSAWFWPGLGYFRRSTEWSGVERVDTPAALTAAVHRHLHDTDHQAAWRARREAFVADEFVFDGGSTGRLVDLLDRLTRETVRSTPARQP